MNKTLEISSSTKNKCSKEEFALFWAELCAGYPHTSTTAGTMMRYYSRLNRYTEAQLRTAGNLAADECEFFPTPAKIIALIRLENDVPDRPTLLDEPRPSKEEATRLLEDLHAYIKQSEAIDDKRHTEKVFRRKAELRAQAVVLGVGSGKNGKGQA